MISSTTLEKLLKFRKDRDWEQFHTFKNLAVSISLEAAELLEHIQWIADDQVQNIVREKRSEIAAEMADIAIYLTYVAHDLNIDLESAVREKLQSNERKYPVEKARGNASKYTEI